ncbi:unnamed protein product [Cuscuta campestris]|uniref:HMA domain-containing protein n=1 Tax=Cuscuta campestris TaxID=132261 RepID=A0A484NNE3_9ASTE|nr:unnamed protein product [Cuscuta campestris]
MMVEMDCRSCEWRARTAAKRIKGVTRVDVDADREKMTVVGYVDPVEVLEKVRRATGKRVEFWRPEMEDLRPCSVSAATAVYETRDPSPRHTVEMKVEMDCSVCKRRARRSMQKMKGVVYVDVDADQLKVTVMGYVDPEKVLDEMRRATGMKAEYWRPETAVNRVPVDGNNSMGSTLAYASSSDFMAVTTFNDENPNACATM